MIEPWSDEEIAYLRAQLSRWPQPGLPEARFLATIDARDARIEALEEALRRAEEHLQGYEGRDGVRNTFACSYATQVIAAVLTPR